MIPTDAAEHGDMVATNRVSCPNVALLPVKSGDRRCALEPQHAVFGVEVIRGYLEVEAEDRVLQPIPRLERPVLDQMHEIGLKNMNSLKSIRKCVITAQTERCAWVRTFMHTTPPKRNFRRPQLSAGTVLFVSPPSSAHSCGVVPIGGARNE